MNKRKLKLYFLTALLIILNFTKINGQTKDLNNSNLIQFSGLLLSADSIFGVPFASVSVKGKPYGTYTGLDGYFSFVAQKGDTIMFSHVEFKPSFVIIPDSLKENKYTILKLMTQDTFYLPGVVIRPMPNRATFDYNFVSKTIPNDDLARAKYNLERERIKEQMHQLQGSSYEAYKNLVRQQLNNQQYQYGQIPPIGLLNPFAWLEFFNMWKKGNFKNDTKIEPISPVAPVVPNQDSNINQTPIILPK